MISFPDFNEERALWSKGYDLVIGIDEVGRGCFAGPIVASAVALAPQIPNGVTIDDSKRLKPHERKRSAVWIKENCLAYGIGEIDVATINRVGIGKATTMAMRKAVGQLVHSYMVKIVDHATMQPFNHSFVLVDAFHIKYLRGIGLANQKAIKKGDQKSISIAAASIIAKVYRDKLMQKLARKHVLYGWGRNKGYGTKFHQEAIKKNGATKMHRIIFVETFLRSQGLALRG